MESTKLDVLVFFSADSIWHSFLRAFGPDNCPPHRLAFCRPRNLCSHQIGIKEIVNFDWLKTIVVIKSASKKLGIVIGCKRLFSSNRHQRNCELWLVEKKTRIFCSHQIVVCGKICHFTGVTSSFEQKYVWRKLKILNKQSWENVLHYRKPMKILSMQELV